MSVGVDVGLSSDLPSSLDSALRSGARWVVAPLVHPRYRRAAQPRCHEPATRSDLLLPSEAWSRQIVGKLSAWIALDSPHAALRKRSELAFKQEIAWAAHLSLPSVLLEIPSERCVNLARHLQWACLSSVHTQLLVRVPMCAPVETQLSPDLPAPPSPPSPWASWSRLHALCESAPNLAVALEITADLPDDPTELERWCGEPVKALLIPTSIFLTNKKGYPTLSRRHQAVIARLLTYLPKLILVGRPDEHPEGISAHINYLLYLASKQTISETEKLERPYYDYLQAPLQPLQDNLESQTYETFEKDPVKYKQYQEATRQALIDLHPKGTPDPVVMVVGAGRGPLVSAALAAARDAGRKIKLYALDKNENAVITLQNRWLNEPEWAECVTVVSSDMREWQRHSDCPVKADILISELLGSWGDNELSPECLDGAQLYLKEGGISIPCDYTSYVAPLCSSKLWNEVKQWRELAKFETPFVVAVHNGFPMARALPCFRFEHPHSCEEGRSPDNTRYLQVEWDCPLGATMHGFIGFFHSTLYKDVIISTEPSTASEGMFSWFPLFIPLRHPVLVPDGGRVEAHFWRNVSRHKVWYEWAMVEPQKRWREIIFRSRFHIIFSACSIWLAPVILGNGQTYAELDGISCAGTPTQTH